MGFRLRIGLSPEGVTPVDLIATAYWAYDVTLMKQMATATGRTAEAAEYGEMFEKIKEAFVKAYTRPDGFVGGVPPPPVFASATATKLSDQPVETQTGYVLAINMNLLPESLRKAAGQRLADRIAANHGQLGTGFLGTPYLLAALTDTGHLDVAYHLLLDTNYPSWGYLVEHGATTMWERWNGDQMRERSEHEFVQPLCVWGGGGLDLSVCGGDRYGELGCGISYDLFASEF